MLRPAQTTSTKAAGKRSPGTRARVAQATEDPQSRVGESQLRFPLTQSGAKQATTRPPNTGRSQVRAQPHIPYRLSSAPFAQTLGVMGDPVVHHVITLGGFLTRDAYRPLRTQSVKEPFAHAGD